MIQSFAPSYAHAMLPASGRADVSTASAFVSYTPCASRIANGDGPSGSTPTPAGTMSVAS